MPLKLQLDGEAWSAVLEDLAKALGKKGPPVCERAAENLIYPKVLVI